MSAVLGQRELARVGFISRQVTAVGQRRGPAEARLDVIDPYARVAEVAETCARQIDELPRRRAALTGSRKIAPWTT